ncbi:hypothetical protein [Paraburkholderia rhynchosiae]|uniref:Uncharacterized protein n=1 Tax=Paraburkholderia rhynchosiae TaxID=487049 RepID=A0A2N7WK38_9BURK|nr:hypothetical protein [Paraburkholderia rhynchosiae]PMS29790.1 hypothetical protein C0Z16_17590 [Paraburkholderia rhynchosiae]CAB3697485.1 hypothetical protein LMG27174_03490 [Paraburkholderia rhynchosiae]
MSRIAHKLSGDERRIMLPLLLLSIIAVAGYFLVRDWRMEELGLSAIFDIVMIFVVLGGAAFLGVVSCIARRREAGEDGQSEGYCFLGALIGAIVFFVAILN